MLGSAGDWRKQLESLGGGSSRLQGFSGSSGWRRGLWGMKVSCLDSSRYSRLRKTMFISLSAMSELKWLQVTESHRDMRTEVALVFSSGMCQPSASAIPSHGYRMATISPDTTFTPQMGELERTGPFMERGKQEVLARNINTLQVRKAGRGWVRN